MENQEKKNVTSKKVNETMLKIIKIGCIAVIISVSTTICFGTTRSINKNGEEKDAPSSDQSILFSTEYGDPIPQYCQAEVDCEFEKVELENKKESYISFLKNYPNSNYESVCNERIALFELEHINQENLLIKNNPSATSFFTSRKLYYTKDNAPFSGIVYVRGGGNPGSIIIEFMVKNGKKHGVWRWYDERNPLGGSIQRFENGLMNGPSVVGNRNSPTLFIPYQNGGLNGYYINHYRGIGLGGIDEGLDGVEHRGGVIYGIGTYSNNVPDGFWREELESSLDSGYYINGKREGCWYVTTSQIYSKGWYKSGAKDSLWISYKIDGCGTYRNPTSCIVVDSGYYKNGLKEGFWFEGRSKSGNYKSGQKDGLWIYEVHEKYSPPFKFEETYQNNKLHGPYKYYKGFEPTDKQLILTEEGNYKYGEKDGIWKTYYKDGTLREEITYLNGFEKSKKTY